MAARRDELDAYVFARKRVVAAFLRGGNTTSDEGAPKPVKTFMASLIVGGLLLAGYGVIGLVKKDTPPANWQRALIVDKDTASRYLYTEDTKQLHSVLNLVSARLALPANDYHVVVVPHRLVASTPHGAPVGIPGAPDGVPAASDPAVRDLTMCAEPGPSGQPVQTLLVGVAPPAADRLGDNGAALVRTRTGGRWVIAAGRRYLIRDDTALKGFLGTALPANDAELVSQSWLALLPVGSPVDFHSPTGLGGAAPTNLPTGLNRIGTVVRTTDGDGQRYVVTAQGLAPVTETIADVLMSDPRNDQNRGGVKAISLAATSQANTAAPYGPTDWPARPVTVREVGAAQTVCAQDPTALGVAGGPVVSVSAGLPDADAARSRVRVPTGAGQDGADDVFVKPGLGAMAQAVAGGATDAGPVYLISSAGTRFQLVPPDPDPTAAGSQPTLQDTLTQLGFSGPPVRVSAAWLAFLPTGQQLNHTRAILLGAGG